MDQRHGRSERGRMIIWRVSVYGILEEVKKKSKKYDQQCRSLINSNYLSLKNLEK